MKKLTALLLAVILLSSVGIASAATLLKYGDFGTDVALLETKLAGMGLYTGAIDRKFGYELYQAVRAFQAKAGLKVDGVAGPKTLEALGMYTPVIPSPPAPAPDPADKMLLGSAGPLVAEVQNRLMELGYFAGPVDGYYGDSTFRAVVAFQKNNALYGDGIVGSATRTKLFSKYAIGKDSSTATSVLRLMYGDKGATVAQLQEKLLLLKYTSSAPDGTFGYGTYLAVRAFQAKNGLKVDGVVGPLTWGKLFGASPIPADAPAKPVVVNPDRIKYGDSGPLVTHVQQRLVHYGYYSAYAVDGKFGYSTYLAVRSFQYNNGLKVDGVVGPKTTAKLDSATATPKPVKK